MSDGSRVTMYEHFHYMQLLTDGRTDGRTDELT